MILLRLLRDYLRLWLDVRQLRRQQASRQPFRTFHGERPRMTGYRRDPCRRRR